MIAGKIYFKGYKCFKKEWVGFEEIKPINVIIGKNNTGKSHLLDYVGFLCNGFPLEKTCLYKIESILTEIELKNEFVNSLKSKQNSKQLYGKPWENHGKYFVNTKVVFEADYELNPTKLCLNNKDGLEEGIEDTICTGRKDCKESREDRIKGILKKIANKNNNKLLLKNEFSSKQFRRLRADRDILADTSDQNKLDLGEKGGNASNLSRICFTTSDKIEIYRSVKNKLINGINEIFGCDGRFEDIKVLQLSASQSHKWELYFTYNNNDIFSLSESGSGLKTIILVLLNLLVIPNLEQKKPSEYVFAFEELENNLHPALLRNLLKYIEDYIIKNKGVIVFLTTHSSVALDFFSSAENVQFLHVTHDGESAKVTPVAAHFDKLNVINDLGTKPSDLLQANGIIWVEGPSDRIYVNRWIQLLTDGKYREGRHYQCAFYGGSLLAHLEASSPDESNEDFVNLITINPNIIVICDSDKKSETDTNKPRVERIMEQINASGAKRDCIVTQCKEVENYLTGAVIKRAFGDSSSSEMPPDPEQYQSIFDESGEEASYWERITGKKSCEKFKIASRCAAVMEMGDLERFGLKDDIRRIVRKIEKWNR